MSESMFSAKLPIQVERDPKTGLIPCVSCTQCCQYVAIEIDTPEDRKDFDNIRWYLYHPGVEVYIDHDETWNVVFYSRCENLQSDGKCGIYETRPMICRDFSVHICEPNTGEPAEKVLMRTAADLEQWMRLTRTDVRLERQEAARAERQRRRAEARARDRKTAGKPGRAGASTRAGTAVGRGRSNGSRTRTGRNGGKVGRNGDMPAPIALRGRSGRRPA
jgi:Fe-S-cluster containining protein